MLVAVHISKRSKLKVSNSAGYASIVAAVKAALALAMHVYDVCVCEQHQRQVAVAVTVHMCDAQHKQGWSICKSCRSGERCGSSHSGCVAVHVLQCICVRR